MSEDAQFKADNRGKSENIRRAERKEEEARTLIREATYLRDLEKRLDALRVSKL